MPRVDQLKEPDLVIADSGNAPESRLRDVVLLRVEADEFLVWVWASGLKNRKKRAQLCLFNLTPPHGTIPIKLGELNWHWTCEDLAVFKLLPPTFETHFGDILNASPSCELAEGQTLLTNLRSVPQGSGAIERLQRIVEIASISGSLVQAAKSLDAYLDEIIVPAASQPVVTQLPTTETAIDDKLRKLRRLSIWTPGTNEGDFLAFYVPVVGENEARRLWDLSRESIAAVGTGDFGKQVDLGARLSKVVPGSKVLAGEAAYFKGEGFRLLADMKPASAQREELRAQAVEQYAIASTLLENDPRPLRGLGRITEVKGDYDKALRYFTRAKGLCLSEMSRDSMIPQLDLAHEILRTSRHFIHCLLDIRATNPASVWNQVRKEQELEGYLRECENLHLEYMPTFRIDPDWYYIEWFMGLVFLAKAWGSLGNLTQMQRTLVNALDARRRIFNSAIALSQVERANLEWWLAVARNGLDGWEPAFRKAVERLQIAIQANDSNLVTKAIEEIVSPFIPPWSSAPDK